MPIYEYQCASCDHELEVLQKINDKQLRKCPECGKQKLRRLMSAPSFRLKGEGWYETDFKSDSDKKRNLAGDNETEAKSESSSDAKAENKADNKADSKSDAKSGAKADTKTAAKSDGDKSSAGKSSKSEKSSATGKSKKANRKGGSSSSAVT